MEKSQHAAHQLPPRCHPLKDKRIFHVLHGQMWFLTIALLLRHVHQIRVESVSRFNLHVLLERRGVQSYPTLQIQFLFRFHALTRNAEWLLQNVTTRKWYVLLRFSEPFIVCRRRNIHFVRIAFYPRGYESLWRWGQLPIKRMKKENGNGGRLGCPLVKRDHSFHYPKFVRTTFDSCGCHAWRNCEVSYDQYSRLDSAPHTSCPPRTLRADRHRADQSSFPATCEWKCPTPMPYSTSATKPASAAIARDAPQSSLPVRW